MEKKATQLYGVGLFFQIYLISKETWRGRALFSQHPAAINLLDMNDPTVVLDTDTPEDFENFLSDTIWGPKTPNK